MNSVSFSMIVWECIMPKMEEVAELKGGISQLRIREALTDGAPTYFFYGQPELETDLAGISTADNGGGAKQIRTLDKVSVLTSGAVAFSLISGKAAVVGAAHDGYILTQNFVKLTPRSSVDPFYLAYLLNENADVRHQLLSGQQGSATLRFTVKQLSAVLLPDFPSLEVQSVIGELYFNQLKLNALKKHQADLGTALVLGKIKGVRW